MVKSRFSVLDIRVIARNLRRTVVGLRVANIYDINNKTYVFKLRSPETRQLLLVESGVRIHTTKFERDKSDLPSVFTLKLRRLIQKKRIEAVSQLGVDRVLDIQFGSGQAEYHLIVEFYAQGNIILTDGEYKIVTLLRTHTYEATGEVIAPGHVYNVKAAREFELLTRDGLQQIFLDVRREIDEQARQQQLDNGEQDGDEEEDEDDGDGRDDTKHDDEPANNNDEDDALLARADDGKSPGEGKKKKPAAKGPVSNAKRAAIKPKLKKVRKLRVWGTKNTGPAQLDLKSFLTGKLTFGTEVVEHALAIAGIDPSTKMGAFHFEPHLDAIFAVLQQVQVELFDDSTALQSNATTLHQGYLILRGGSAPRRSSPDSGAASSSSSTAAPSTGLELVFDPLAPQSDLIVYDMFVPLRYAQIANRQYYVFATFDEAVDEFFSKIECQKAAVSLAQKENQVQKKLDKVKQMQQDRVTSLVQQEENYKHLAELIEGNLDDVDAAISILRRAVDQHLAWDAIARIVKEEKRNGDPIANIIHKLDLAHGKVTLLLSQRVSELWDDETANEQVTSRPVQVVIDIGQTAFANAGLYHALRKASGVKREKTAKSVKKAVVAAESKAREQLQQVGAASTIREARKKAWFEKFYWFVTTDGYIVVCGRDAQQNELIVKRHLRKGDIYIHADIHGASSCVLKNPSGQPVPPSSLTQAGCMSICRSGAWNAKVISNAWWVYHHQVSKSAPTGEYLPTGSFMIRGTKNMLPPTPPVLSFGYLFKIHESSVVNHLDERNEKAARSPLRLDSNAASSSSSASSSLSSTASSSLSSTASSSLSSTASSSLPSPASTNSVAEQAASQEDVDVDVEDEVASGQDGEDEPDVDPFAALDVPIFAVGDEPEPLLPNEQPVDVSDQPEPLVDDANQDQDQDQDDAADNNNDDEDKDAGRTGQRSKPRLSAKQRKLLKKGGGKTPEAPPAPAKKAADKPAPAAVKAEPQPAMSRAKRMKMKRAQKKYKDQDEEERALRMTALDPSGEAKRAVEQARLAEIAAVRAQREAERKAAWELKQKMLEANREKKSRAERRQEERSELRALEEEEGLMGDESEDLLNSLTVLDTLVEVPHPDDILLWAVPVCGPYSAMQHFKYKAKIVPGSSKRGKLARQCNELFVRLPAASQRERELIKGVPLEDSILILVGDAKVVIPSSLAQQLKQDKKNSKAAKLLEVERE